MVVDDTAKKLILEQPVPVHARAAQVQTKVFEAEAASRTARIADDHSSAAENTMTARKSLHKLNSTSP